MTVSGDGGTGNRPAGGSSDGLSYLPPVWVIVVLLLSLNGLFSAWPMLFVSQLPESFVYLVQAGMVFGVINILWGLYVLSLAYSRSAFFPRHFTAWQVVNIFWLAAREIYVFVMPEFVFTAYGLLYSGVEIAIGLFCLLLVRRTPSTTAAYANPVETEPSLIVSIAAALLGVVLGGAVGAGAGLLIGSVIADVTDVSCFEGGCGYFAVAFGLVGLLIGAIGGCILAVVWSRRRKALPTS